MKEYINILAETPLFRGIGDKEINDMFFFLNPLVKKYKKGNFIISLGAPVSEAGIILEGKTQVIKEDIRGNRSIIAELSQGDMFAEAFACARTPHSPVSVAAQTDCRIMFLNFDRIVNMRGVSAAAADKLIRNMMMIIARKNVFLNSKLEHISKRTIREKLLSYFNELSVQNASSEFSLPFSKTALADYLFIDRSAMSRELQNMRQEGIIYFSGSKFKIKKIVKNI